MNKLKIAALLAIAGMGISTSAQAFTYSTGDVLIGFRSTNSGITNDYLIDIGQSLFTTAAANGGHVVVGTFGTDLSSVSSFDPSWFTDGTTVWGIAGGNLSGDTARTLYVGYGENTANPTPGTSYNGRTSTAQNTTQGLFNTVGNNAASGNGTVGSAVGNTGTTNLTLNGFAFQAGATATSWNGQENKGNGFGQFAGFDSAIGVGSTGNSIDLYKIAPTVGAAPVLMGTFNVDSTGTITFNSPVPEPSALTALAGGIGLLGFLRRRRSVIA